MEDKISVPGRYSGYSIPEYNGAERSSQYVAMRDGTRIAVDYYRPVKNGLAADALWPRPL